MEDKYLEARREYVRILHDFHELNEEKRLKTRYNTILQRLIQNTQRLIHVLDVIKIATDGSILPWLSDDKKSLIASDIKRTFGYEKVLTEWSKDHDSLMNHVMKRPTSIRNGILQYDIGEI